jgi:signal transduction histidine kinase/ActR/RegA family two-component response regulator
LSVTARLIVVIVAVLAPALAAAVWGAVRAHEVQTAAAEQNLRQLAHALASVVEEELAHRAGLLEALARSPSLQQGDLPRFYEFARTIAPTVERTIVLADAGGKQFINTRLPQGSAQLPVSRTLPDLRRELNLPEDARLVSNAYFAPVGKRFSFAVQVPVTHEGRVRYYLSMGSFGDTLQKALFDERLGPGWNASIVDRAGVLLARRIEPERYVGKPATADLMEHIRGAREGLFETVRLDGVPTLTAYAPIGDSGWTYVVSMPRAELQAGLTRALAAASLIALGLIALGLLVAIAAGRSIARQMRLANRDLERRVEAAVAQTKRAQEALLHNQKLEALGRLTGGIAHDFNNLLQTISMAMEIVLRNAQVAPVRAAAEAGKRAVQSAVKLTGQLMTFGRNQNAAPQTVDLRDQAMKLQDLVSGALRRDIHLAFDFPGELWPVTLDVVQLELALLNASLNARDAMPRGGRLVIGARNAVVREGELPEVRAGEYVRLTVADGGHGIPAELLPRVFEPFFTTKEVGKGSGLGLAQIYGFAVQSGGTATLASSTDGSGTTLSLWLPRAPGAVRAAAAGARLLDRQPTVLMVEDDALVQSVAAPALEHAGFRVVVARDVNAALEALAREAGVDIVFSDIVMPGGRSGVDLANELRRRRPSLPVVLATGYADVPAIPPGTRVLRKPYLIEELTAALSEALQPPLSPTGSSAATG